MRDLWKHLILVSKRNARRVEAVSFLTVAVIMVRFIPFRFWRRSMWPHGVASEGIEHVDDPTSLLRAKSVGRSVAITAVSLPFDAPCLPQAMAARWMLKWRKIDARLYIGAARNNSDASIDLHAWLMSGNTYVTGHNPERNFTSFQETPKAK